MKPTAILKRANSKGQLAQAVVFYQRALSHYAKEENWAVRTVEQPNGSYTVIEWIGDDDPTYAAQVSLGQRKPDPTYLTRNKPKNVRLPDNESTATPGGNTNVKA